MPVSTSFLFLNHSSILIEHDGCFVLTDPWYQRPAFGAWLPTPPMAVHPAYVTSLARASKSFTIVVSHGHDDHLDDQWLALFPKETVVVLPKYPAPGVFSRIAKHGFTTIKQIDKSGVEVGPFYFRAYFDPESTAFDALVAIETPDSLIVHANDNWRTLPDDNRIGLIELVGKHGPDRTCYLSQCNIADSYPFTYDNYTFDEKVACAAGRVKKMTVSSLKNAKSIGAKFFVSYAGHTKTFDALNSDSLKLTGYRDHNFIVGCAKEANIDDLEVLDMVPGDRFDFQSVHKMFGLRLDDDVLKDETVRYYQAYGIDQRCDTYRFKEIEITAAELERLTREFLVAYEQYALSRIGPPHSRPEVVGDAVTIACPELDMQVSLEVGKGLIETPDSSHARYTLLSIPAGLWHSILKGETNFENISIGGQAKMHASSREYYNGNLMYWFGLFGYVYQRNQISQSMQDHPESKSDKQDKQQSLPVK